jgi:hypothetical protein
MICQKCKKDKGDDFRKKRTVCRECDNESAREYRKSLKEREKPDSIICNVCGLEKTEFRINRKKCLDCEREHGRKYRKETDTAKIWVENNREKMSQMQHEWYEKEKKTIREKRNQRMKDDPLFNLGIKHRTALRNFIRNNLKTSKYVNCDSEQFCKWIQFQFTDEMNWDNYNKQWVLDHVVPIDTFLTEKYSSEIVFHWVNVQPISKKDNLVKNKYIDTNQCLEHLENIRLYSKICKFEYPQKYMDVLGKICL